MVVAVLAAACAVLKLPSAVVKGVSAAVKFAADGNGVVKFALPVIAV